MENENTQSRSSSVIRVLIFLMLALLLSGCGTVCTRMMRDEKSWKFVGHAPYPAVRSDVQWLVKDWEREEQERREMSRKPLWFQLIPPTPKQMIRNDIRAWKVDFRLLSLPIDFVLDTLFLPFDLVFGDFDDRKKFFYGNPRPY